MTPMAGIQTASREKFDSVYRITGTSYKSKLAPPFAVSKNAHLYVLSGITLIQRKRFTCLHDLL